MLTPADSSVGLSSEDVALNGRTLAMVGAKGSNPKLPELPALAKMGSGLSLPGLSFGFFGEWGSPLAPFDCVALCLGGYSNIRYATLSELRNPRQTVPAN